MIDTHILYNANICSNMCAHLNLTLASRSTVDSQSPGQELFNHIIIKKIRQKLKKKSALLSKGTIL